MKNIKICLLIGGEGDVMVLVHDSKSETAKERAKSFQDEIAENYPDIRTAEVVYCDQLDDLKKQMAEEQNEGLEEGGRKAEKESITDADAVQYLIEQHPGLKGIFGTNDSTTMLGLEAIRQAEQAWEEGQKEEKDQGEDTDQKEDGRTQEQTGEDAREPGGETKEAARSGDGAGEDQEPVQDSQAGGNESGDNEENEASQEDSENEGPADEASGDKDGRADSESSVSAEETTDPAEIVLMGFDVGREQLKALEEGEISGLVVQNPFGIGYASVVAAARTVLQSGNEAQVSTGYLWVTQDNMNDASIQKMLYQ